MQQIISIWELFPGESKSIKTTLWDLINIIGEDLPAEKDAMIAKRLSLLLKGEKVTFVDIPKSRKKISANDDYRNRLDHRYMNMQPIGCVGELYTGGDGVSRGYRVPSVNPFEKRF